MGRRAKLAWIVGVLLLVVPTAGAAPKPVLGFGLGRWPSAVTDQAGILHVVWDVAVPLAPQAKTMYCRVPVGSKSCSPVELPAVPHADRPVLLRRSDGALFVVVTGEAGTELTHTTYLLSSRDGGASWSSPVSVGTGMERINSAQLSADGNAVETVGDTTDDSSFGWQRVPLTGGPEQRVVPLASQTEDVIQPELGRLSDGRTIVAGTASGTRAAFRVLGSGDPYTPASSTPWGRVKSFQGFHPRLASGRSGTWVLSEQGSRLAVRRWNGTGFAVVRREAGGLSTRLRGLAESFDLAVDPAGRVILAWTRSIERCGGRICLSYRRAVPPRPFGPTVTYPVGRKDSVAPWEVVVTADAKGRGWIVWRDGSHADGGGLVRATPIGG